MKLLTATDRVKLHGPYDCDDGKHIACLVTEAECYNFKTYLAGTWRDLETARSVQVYEDYQNANPSFDITVGDKLRLGDGVWDVVGFTAVEHSFDDILEVEMQVEKDCTVMCV